MILPFLIYEPKNMRPIEAILIRTPFWLFWLSPDNNRNPGTHRKGKNPNHTQFLNHLLAFFILLAFDELN